MRVILSGGGTIGSVSPLLALYQEIKQQQPATEFFWVATRRGPEHALIDSYGISRVNIFSGKLRRYFSGWNFIDPLLIFLGFWQSLFIIFRRRPQVIVSAGGYVAVPLVWAAWLLRRPTLIHQQDVEPGLANLLMARFATKITTTFEQSRADFFVEKTTVVGNPVRADILTGNKAAADKFLQFNQSVPTVLAIGGGTGARSLNSLIQQAVPELVNVCQIIHLTGGRAAKISDQPRYRQFDFLVGQLKDVYAAADLVISRAGMSALTELAALGKPTIVIPIADSHQEANASQFFKNNAIVYIPEKNLSPAGLTEAVKQLLDNPVERQNLSRNIKTVLPTGAAAAMAKLIFAIR